MYVWTYVCILIQFTRRFCRNAQMVPMLFMHFIASLVLALAPVSYVFFIASHFRFLQNLVRVSTSLVSMFVSLFCFSFSMHFTVLHCESLHFSSGSVSCFYFIAIYVRVSASFLFLGCHQAIKQVQRILGLHRNHMKIVQSLQSSDSRGNAVKYWNSSQAILCLHLLILARRCTCCQLHILPFVQLSLVHAL